MDDVTQVRLLITDVPVESTDLYMDSPEPLFTNSQVAAFLSMNGGSVRLAAAEALETIAVSEVLMAKKIRTQDLATDGPAVAAELRALAAALRKRAGDLGEDPAVDTDLFEVVDTIPGAIRPERSDPVVWGL